tara:strand:- start:3741 stop:5021 length:1281 start_codon:yes stop_codon:yes gene_type:complete
MEQISKSKKECSVEILCIGTELLLGNIINTNAQWISEELSSFGMAHYRQTVVGDNLKRIKKSVLEASNRSRILITTGGLGPTPDDLTHEAISAAFNSHLLENQEIIKVFREKIKNNTKSSHKSILKQALIPSGANIIPNSIGTAAGIIWTPIKDFTILTFPGVPEELKSMWSETGKELIKSISLNKKVFRSKTLHFTNIGEYKLSEKVTHLLKNKNPTVAPYASLGHVKLRITAQAKNEDEAEKIINPIEKEIIKLTKDNLFGYENDSLASVVINLLRKRKETLAVAESCTGGGIGSAISNVSGCSDVFLGGVISYSDLIKQQILGVPKELLDKYGAVSAPVAKAMAEGSIKRFKADWVIAVSGIAGPAGGSPKKPIGLVHFAIAGPDFTHLKKELFGSYRERNAIQKLSVLKGLDLLRLLLLKKS